MITASSPALSNRVLVCEGACNGLKVKDLDLLIERAGLPDDGYVPSPPEGIVAQLHALRHSVHVQLAPSLYACVECGEQRRF